MAIGADLGSQYPELAKLSSDRNWNSFGLPSSERPGNGRPTLEDLQAENDQTRAAEVVNRVKNKWSQEDSSSKQIGGDHYAKHTVSPWDVYSDWFGKAEMRGYLLGCIVKYIVRYRDKGGILDLEKAKHVLDRLIEEEGK